MTAQKFPPTPDPHRCLSKRQRLICPTSTESSKVVFARASTRLTSNSCARPAVCSLFTNHDFDYCVLCKNTSSPWKGQSQVMQLGSVYCMRRTGGTPPTPTFKARLHHNQAGPDMSTETCFPNHHFWCWHNLGRGSILL